MTEPGQSILEPVRKSPLLIRVVPFVVFLVLTFCQTLGPDSSRYWFYLAKTVVGAWMLVVMWPLVKEMRWAVSIEAILAGVLVFVMWVGLDGWYPTLDSMLQKIGMGSSPSKPSPAWNPHTAFGEGAPLAWMFVAVRLIGSTLVVPPLEEVFYRSFLYRYIVHPDFESVPLGRWVPKALIISALVFGFAHHEWLPAILCACVYQGLVCWKKRLGDAMVAHALTNLLLGLWVIWKGAWHFW